MLRIVRSGGPAARRVAFAVAAAVLACAAGTSRAATIGPGTAGATTGADSGDRLNVSDAPSTAVSLPAGTYDIDSFAFNATGAGDVVPFLATSTAANNYSLLWIGSAAPGVASGAVNVNPAGGFVLDAAASVYAGFYTAAGGRVAFADGTGVTTDHNGTATVPRGGVALSTFSNPDLNRTYAFSITANPTARKTAGGGILANGGADSGERLNIDNNRSLTLAAGTYDVDDFSFNGTAVGGTVTPFLARLTGADTYQTVWVGGAVPGVSAGVSVDPVGSFTLASGDTLYAGFYTAAGGRVAFTEGPGRPPGFGVTDHSSTVTAVTVPGESIGWFSNPDLQRTYAFSIGVNPAVVPEPAAAAAILFAGAFVGRRRRAV
jgi:hypothetical protein